MASDSKPKVFISCTSEDLGEYREAVSKALRPRFETLEMGLFGARPDTPTAESLKEVLKADLFVGFYAWRYGTVPPGSACSITEAEYEQARAAKIPRICFLLKEGHPWPQERRQPENADRLEQFKKRIQESLVVERFTSPDNLALLSLKAAQEWSDERLPQAVDPHRRDLLHLLDQRDRDWAGSLGAKTAGRLLDLFLFWRERRQDPTGAGGSARLQPLHTGALAQLCNDCDRLAIVGPPESGKSLALVRLARDLAAEVDRRAEPLARIPVVLGLAVWQEKDASLSDYIVRRLTEERSIKPADARSWIEADQLLLLLDGLDTIAPERRGRCAAAIAEHLSRHGGGMAVCLRTAAYEELGEALPVQAEVFLQRLDAGQIEARLAGPAYAALRERLREDEGLRGLAERPLMLHLLAETYAGESPAALQSLDQNAAEEKVVLDYVETLENRQGSGRYSRARTRRSLRWLAGRMKKENVTRFEIENLEAGWLGSGLEVFLYALLSRTLGGALLTLPALVFYPLLLPCGAAAGALTGVLDALPIWRVADRVTAGSGRARRLAHVSLVGLGAYAVAFLIARTGGILNPAGLVLSFALVFTLVFGTRPAGLRGDVLFREERREEHRGLPWSWRGALTGAATGFVFLLLFQLLDPGGKPHWIARFLFPLAAALPGALFGGFLGGLWASLPGTLVRARQRPNLGLRKIARNAFRAGALLTGACAALLAGLAAFFRAAGLSSGLHGVGPGASRGALAALLAGFCTAFAVAGMDAVQHFTLRFLLSAAGRFPWRWIRFLRHAADRGFLEQNEGGWEFLHSRVRDRIAALPLDQPLDQRDGRSRMP